MGDVPQQDLTASIYAELHRMAAGVLRGRGKRASLQVSDLVNEAYLRLAKAGAADVATSRFFPVAAKAMRSELVDHARRAQRMKRDPGGARVVLDDICATFFDRSIDILALDEALHELEKIDPKAVRAIELRFFAGRSMQEVATYMHMPLRSAERLIATTRSWLHAQLT
jgi:RNA polymerase sigma factor (TIGR02999 family)